MTPGTATVLAGQLNGPKAIVDGAGDAASFSQPRGLCQSPLTHDLLVVDGISNTAVLRKITTNTGGAQKRDLE